MSNSNDKNLDQEAILYHKMPPAGKLSIVPTKPMANQRDLSLAYSPGVAAACMLIADDKECPETVAGQVTARGNLVAVVSNGTAVLGLGNIGALASKPVMEGKAVLFKKFSGIDVFDIEVNETDVDKFCDVVAKIEPTFGGINLEDIKAPECFEIEKQLRERMNIPVFHDDQHGTAIVTAAAVYNALELQGKDMDTIQVVCSGAGSAALACLNLLESMGLRKDNVKLLDSKGVIYKGRTDYMDDYKARYAVETDARTLDDVIAGADVFLGLSAAGVLKPHMVEKMGKSPLILAMANPNPEIRPEEAFAVRDDVIIGTGRSDYPNQANNVLCFPFIFRGALDVGATTINDDMKIAAVKALAQLARKESDEKVASAYQEETLRFGPDYILPKPFDGRLIQEIAPAVAQAAMDSGVATRPITDMEAYVKKLSHLTNESGSVMTPLTEKAQRSKSKRRVVLAEGEDVRTLRAAQFVLDDGIAQPVLIGRQNVIAHLITELGLRLEIGTNLDVIDPSNYEHYDAYKEEYFRVMDRRGATSDSSATLCRTDNTVIAAMMVRMGHACGMICGLEGAFTHNAIIIKDLIGLQSGVNRLSAMTMLLIEGREPLCLTDTHVQNEPSAEQLVEIVSLASRTMQRFAIEPKIAMLSHSNFGRSKAPSAKKMREATALLHSQCPHLAVDGEMHGDTAFDPQLRKEHVIDSHFDGKANLLVFPNLDSANISYNLLKVQANATVVGPIMMGTAKPCHVLTPAAGARTIVNMVTMLVTHEG